MAQVVSIQIIDFSNLLLNVLYKDFVVVGMGGDGWNFCLLL